MVDWNDVPRTGLLAALAASTLLSLAGACGGKVVFDTGATSAGGAASTTAHPVVSVNASTAIATSGGACLTSVTVGSGPQGPSIVHGTKCVQLGAKACPPASGALSLLHADVCYAIASVDDACNFGTGLCCYDVTEQLMCDG